MSGYNTEYYVNITGPQAEVIPAPPQGFWFQTSYLLYENEGMSVPLLSKYSVSDDRKEIILH